MSLSWPPEIQIISTRCKSTSFVRFCLKTTTWFEITASLLNDSRYLSQTCLVSHQDLPECPIPSPTPHLHLPLLYSSMAHFLQTFRAYTLNHSFDGTMQTNDYNFLWVYFSKHEARYIVSEVYEVYLEKIQPLLT